MKQKYKKVGKVVNIAADIKIYMANHVAGAGNLLTSWTLTQRLSFVGLMAFSAVAGVKAFVL